MAKAKPFKQLTDKMPVESRARVQARVQKTLANMPLEELRTARNFTQAHLAKLLGVEQSAVSRMERRTDVYVSTLASFIEAMGGRLEIRAIFPEGQVTIN